MSNRPPPPPYQPNYNQYQQGSYPPIGNQPSAPPAYSSYPYPNDKQPLLHQGQGYGSTNSSTYAHTTIIQHPSVPIVVVGGCPACRVGVLEDDYTCLGVCCAIFFFPLGILCCLAMKQRRCPNCGAVFG